MEGESLADCRILVVEDTYFIAQDIAQALNKAGAVVVGPARSPEEALALLASEQVDAAVLDIKLHGDMIYPVADALMAEGKPFIFATGYGTASIPAAYKDISRWVKPFDARALARALPGLIRRT